MKNDITVQSHECVSLEDHLRGVTLVQAKASDIAKALASDLESFGETSVRSFTYSREAFADLLPLKSFGYKYLIIPYNGWSILVCDMILENCHVEALAVSRILGCSAVCGFVMENCRQFHVIRDGSETRSILCYKDGGRWFFVEEGLPFPFENTENYAKIRKASRLSVAVVRDYVGAATGLLLPLVVAPMQRSACYIVERSICCNGEKIIEYRVDVPATISIG